MESTSANLSEDQTKTSSIIQSVEQAESGDESAQGNEQEPDSIDWPYGRLLSDATVNSRAPASRATPNTILPYVNPKHCRAGDVLLYLVCAGGNRYELDIPLECVNSYSQIMSHLTPTPDLGKWIYYIPDVAYDFETEKLLLRWFVFWAELGVKVMQSAVVRQIGARTIYRWSMVPILWYYGQRLGCDRYSDAVIDQMTEWALGLDTLPYAFLETIVEYTKSRSGSVQATAMNPLVKCAVEVFSIKADKLAVQKAFKEAPDKIRGDLGEVLFKRLYEKKKPEKGVVKVNTTRFHMGLPDSS
ncbi:MAG: hypothetical protein M1831_003866 [Alyxoria varia]|nr:MAG: hypothetical protein M1831_003866 [Alyxoria varia]